MNTKTHTSTDTLICSHIDTSMHTQTSRHNDTWICRHLDTLGTSTHEHLDTRTHKHTVVHMHACTHVRLYTCTHRHIFTWTHRSIDTSTHIHEQKVHMYSCTNKIPADSDLCEKHTQSLHKRCNAFFSYPRSHPATQPNSRSYPNQGETLKITIHNRYPVEWPNGYKELVLTERNALGGRHHGLSLVFFILALTMLITGAVFKVFVATERGSQS